MFHPAPAGTVRRHPANALASPDTDSSSAVCRERCCCSAMGSVSEQLEQFAAAAEPQQLLLRDTTPAERSAAHSWVEKHEDPSVRAWEHVSATIEGARVLQVTKPDGWRPKASRGSSATPTPTRPAKQPKERSSAASAGAAPSVCSGSTTVAVGENVHDRLAEFAASAYERMELTGTTAADRSATHGWVEEHEDATIRSWGHESANVGGKRVLILTKPVGTPVPREVDSGALLPKKKKKRKRKRKGPASTEGLSEAELKRREWQKKKQKEAIERQQKGLPRVMPSKRRRANNPRRKGHNNDKQVQPDGQAASSEGSNAGNVGGFMQPGAWQAS